MKPAIVNLSLLLATAVAAVDTAGAESTLANLWRERIHSVVAVEYSLESELSSRTVTSFGVAVDNQGTVVLPWDAIDASVPISQLQHFKAYLPGEVEGRSATYLGSAGAFHFNYVRVDPEMAAKLVPIVHWRTRGPGAVFAGASGDELFQSEMNVGDSVWGIGLRSKDEAFAPYLLTSRIALTQAGSDYLCVTQEAMAGPGLPVFDRDGNWAGLAESSFGQTYLMYSQDRSGSEPIMLVNLEESSAFRWAAGAVERGFAHVPQRPDGRPIAWAGAMALRPQEDGNIMVRKVASTGPAHDAGLRAEDIIIATDGERLPKLRPMDLELAAFQNRIESERPGDRLNLTVRRDGNAIPISIVLEDMGTLAREAQRRLFAGPAVVIREPVASDGGGDGAIVAEVRPDGPAAAAGLRANDKIVGIDGGPARPFFETAGRLESIDGDTALAVVRKGEEAPVVLHVHWSR